MNIIIYVSMTRQTQKIVVEKWEVFEFNWRQLFTDLYEPLTVNDYHK